MANYKGVANAGAWSYAGKQQLHLPPKSPFPTMTSTFVDYGPAHGTTSRGYESREGQKLHQRTSSESCLIEEQPSWLDDLLNEPDTPVKKGGHRRSSSDSFAYLESPSSFSNLENFHQMETVYGDAPLMTLRGAVDFRRPKDDYHTSFYTDANSFGVQSLNRRRESTTNIKNLASHKPTKNNTFAASLEPVSTHKDGISAAAETQKTDDSASHEMKGSSEKGEGSHAKSSSAEVDPKRAKQQFAQRSRVRKLQYIAELERTTQALQVEQAEVSAELEFVDRQHLIVSLENKALRQRLESIAQEQLAKHLEQDMLEREVMRLRMLLYQQQRHYDQQASNSANRDLDLHFAALSLSQGQGQGQGNPNLDSLGGPLHI